MKIIEYNDGITDCFLNIFARFVTKYTKQTIVKQEYFWYIVSVSLSF